MSVSLLLEVAISMVFLYLLGSQVVLSIYELWAGYTNSRGKFLYRKLKGTFGAETVQELYAQKPIAALTPADQPPPQIRPANKGKESVASFFDLTIDNPTRMAWWLGKDGLPAYVPAALFAATFLAMVAPTAATRTDFTTTLNNAKADPPAWYSEKAVNLLTGILNALEADAPLATCQKTVAAWYDDYGERLTGWYKRQVRLWLFLIGLVVAFGGNIDSPFILGYLWAHPLLAGSLADTAAQQTRLLDAAKLTKAEQRATVLKSDTSAKARLSTTIDSLTRRLQASQAQVQVLANHLHGRGFPIGRADSAGQDSARLPRVFFVRQPARTVRQGRRLETIPDYYLRYTRHDTSAVASVPGIRSQHFEWLKKALPLASVGPQDLRAPHDRSQVRPWYEPVFGPQSPSAGSAILGWLLTALALSVGAPFWFDLLCRLVNIRNLGIKPPRPAP